MRLSSDISASAGLHCKLKPLERKMSARPPVGRLQPRQHRRKHHKDVVRCRCTLCTYRPCCRRSIVCRRHCKTCSRSFADLDIVGIKIYLASPLLVNQRPRADGHFTAGMASAAYTAVVHIIGDFFANICQLEELSFGANILILCREFPVFSGLVSQVIRILMHRALPLLRAARPRQTIRV
jgi:hypothetical protein